MFSNQKNKWNLGVKSNFENFEFWVVPISKSALVTTTVHQFQKLGLVLCMVFNQEFEFCVQTFFTSLLKNSIFIHSEARLSSIMQNWKKLLRFHYCIPKGVTNFECLLLNLHTLNYHSCHQVPIQVQTCFFLVAVLVWVLLVLYLVEKTSRLTTVQQPPKSLWPFFTWPEGSS